MLGHTMIMKEFINNLDIGMIMTDGITITVRN
jgi:hypothetical protein